MPLSAILFAFTSIFLWSFLALFSSQVNHLDPFLVVAIALTISGIISIFTIRSWRVSLKVLAAGIFGLFGYHFLYFSAFQFAPPIETNLINYLWPLLIVLLSPLFLTSFKLKPAHILGALLGLTGAALIISGGSLSLEMEYIRGYLLATGAAIVWASYSLLTKRLQPFPTSAVGAFCLISGLLAMAIVFSTAPNQPLESLTSNDWLFLILLGLGPMGIAFFTWDAALKRGDPRVIGSLAYLIPMTSTLVLVVFGGYNLTWISMIAMMLIVAGMFIGSLEFIRTKD